MQAAISGVIVLIDLTNSTALKGAKGFPDWVETMEMFYTESARFFAAKKLQPVKFLGDGVLFFYPGEDEHSLKYRKSFPEGKEFPSGLSFQDIIETAIKTKENWWALHSPLLKHPESRKNFLEMTIALDFGTVIDFNMLMGGGQPDPLGECVDRCFRISSITAPNQIFLSENFYKKLLKEGSFSCGERLTKLSIHEKSLKGIDGQKYVYFVNPCEEEEKWILSDEYRTLLEECKKPSIHKVKLKLLRKRLSKYEPPELQ